MSAKPPIVKTGDPLWKTYDAAWANRIHDILWGLDVQDGRIIRIEDKKWLIVFDKRMGGQWTGVIWFGNTRIYVAPGEGDALTGWDGSEYVGVIDGEYLVVNLRDGTYKFDGNNDGTPPEVDDAEEQVFHVADYVPAVTEQPTREAGYKLNQNTQGDIHARIT